MIDEEGGGRGAVDDAPVTFFSLSVLPDLLERQIARPVRDGPEDVCVDQRGRVMLVPTRIHVRQQLNKEILARYYQRRVNVSCLGSRSALPRICDTVFVSGSRSLFFSCRSFFSPSRLCLLCRRFLGSVSLDWSLLWLTVDKTLFSPSRPMYVSGLLKPVFSRSQ